MIYSNHRCCCKRAQNAKIRRNQNKLRHSAGSKHSIVSPTLFSLLQAPIRSSFTDDFCRFRREWSTANCGHSRLYDVLIPFATLHCPHLILANQSDHQTFRPWEAIHNCFSPCHEFRSSPSHIIFRAARIPPTRAAFARNLFMLVIVLFPFCGVLFIIVIKLSICMSG